MLFTHTTLIAAPLERVWQLTLDIERWPEFTPTMTRLSPLECGPLRVGSRVRIQQPGQPALIWEIRELESPRQFVWETRTPWGMTICGRHLLESQAGKTRNRLELELRGPGSTIVGVLAAPFLWLALVLENRGFRRRAEQA